jgi:hypothetical protein
MPLKNKIKIHRKGRKGTQRIAKAFNRVMAGRDPAIYGRCPEQVRA